MEKEGLGIQIDIIAIIAALIRRAWLIVLAMILGGALYFSYAFYKIAPTYNSSVLFYVNGGVSASDSLQQITADISGLSTARSLVPTYIAILKTRNTLESVIAEASLPYSYGTLYGMVSAWQVSDTEIFSVNVTASSPSETQLIANTIASVLPEKISSIINGTSARVVDYAIMPTARSSPKLKNYLFTGMIIGLMVSAAIVVLIQILDDKIHSEDYLMENYPDIPLLGVIPDIADARKSGTYNSKYYKNYRYYERYKKETEAEKK